MNELAPDVVAVKYLKDFCLELTFADGLRAQVNLQSHVCGKGGVFTALEDLKYFAKVAVNGDIGTIVWPNDSDLSPDFLYALATQSTSKTSAA